MLHCGRHGWGVRLYHQRLEHVGAAAAECMQSRFASHHAQAVSPRCTRPVHAGLMSGHCRALAAAAAAAAGEQLDGQEESSGACCTIM